MKINKHIKSVQAQLGLGSNDTDMLQHLWNNKDKSKVFAVTAKESANYTSREIKFMIAHEGQVVNISELVATVIDGDYISKNDAVKIKGSGFNSVIFTLAKFYDAIKPKSHTEDAHQLRAVSFYTLL